MTRPPDGRDDAARRRPRSNEGHVDDESLGDAERLLRDELTALQQRLPDYVWSTAAGRRLARLLDEFGAPAPSIAGGRRVGQGRRSPEVAKTEFLLDGPIELVVLSVKDSAVRCRPLDSPQPVTLRASGLWEVVPGEVIVVAPRKQWRYARHPYLSGEILSTRLDVQALGLVPLRLEDHGLWHPDEEYWGEDGEPIEAWAQPIIARGPRRAFEMEQVLPGADVDDPDSDPIIEANDAKAAGDRTTARRILMQLCEADVRCLDAHAHLGNLAFDFPDVAIRHYEVGVRIGEWSLGADFDGLLPWGCIDNRPFLRCLHGYGLCCWRLGRFEEAGRIFDRMLWLNPSDNQGARMLIGPLQRRAPWEAREGW